MKLYVVNGGLYHECQGIFDCAYKRLGDYYYCTKCPLKFPTLFTLVYKPIPYPTYDAFPGTNIGIVVSEFFFKRYKCTEVITLRNI